MVACSFPESNGALSPPDGLTEDQVTSLAVWRGYAPAEGMEDPVPMTISCWKPTKEEMDEFQRTGRVWLFIWGGSMPPACLSMTNPFQTRQLPDPSHD